MQSEFPLFSAATRIGPAKTTWGLFAVITSAATITSSECSSWSGPRGRLKLILSETPGPLWLRNNPMRWSIIRLIWFRELRDQLRDRRTVFMIVLLPIVLYPLL